MKVLTKQQILLLHRQLIEQTGGSDGSGMKGFWIPRWQLRFKALTTRMLTILTAEGRTALLRFG